MAHIEDENEEQSLRKVALDTASHVFAVKQREDELRARLAAVVESSDDAIISKSLNGIINTWNKGAERIFGYTSQEVIGKSIIILIPPERQREEEEILSRIKKGERVEHFETVRVTKNGKKLNISITVSPIKDSQGLVVGASKIARDITARKSMEEALRESEAKLKEVVEKERAARIETERVGLVKDEFLATLSHELRTPLNAIVGWSQLLIHRYKDSEELVEGLSIIERNSRQQAKLIDDLLDMSRIISGKLRLDVQEVDFQEVIESAVASIRHSVDAKEIRLHMVLDPLAGPVRGDPNRLQQCCWNLLSNAIKFTPKGGRIQISLERVNSHLEFSIIDSGEGIRPDFLPHVFDRFRQDDGSTTRRHGGLGLGLSIVKHLVELHGGTVSAKSLGIGHGATFIIDLPVLVIHPTNYESPRQHPSSSIAMRSIDDCPNLTGIVVLAVDDETDARNLIKSVLEECGAEVLLAASSAEALKILQHKKPHIIISDIGMPYEDGYDFIKKVRNLSPERGGRTPAAALTAFARAEDRTRALRAGYQMHITKPVEPAELSAVVASLAG